MGRPKKGPPPDRFDFANKMFEERLGKMVRVIDGMGIAKFVEPLTPRHKASLVSALENYSARLRAWIGFLEAEAKPQ